jgi:PAS domain S-box-containing protein
MWMAWGPDLTFLYNDTYARVTLGEKHPWALGRSARTVWSEIWDDLQPRVDRVLTTGEATWDEGLLLFLRRSGFVEETYHTFSYSPLTDDAGKVAGMLCVVTEETERVLGERQLASLRGFASELNSAITEEAVTHAVIAGGTASQRDLPFMLVYLVDGKDALGRLCCGTGFAHGDPAAPETIDLDDGGAVWPIARVLETDDSFTIGVEGLSGLPTGVWKDPPDRALLVPIAQRGQQRAAGVLVAGLNPYRKLTSEYEGYIKLIAGQIAASLANAHAYDQERKRAQALAELDRAKTMFFSNVSHELRTPLTLMLGPLEDELARAAPGSDSRRSLELIQRNALRLLKLVNTLLEFSRVESGRLTARFEPVDLAALTAEYASTFRSSIERAGLRYIVDSSPLPEPVYIDREIWERIILNLLSNALKSTFHGEIEVSVRLVPEGVRVAVRDTGTGIPIEDVPHLFERFRRVEGARRRTHEGSGIGLALVKELVAMHGGAIAVDTTVGIGSTFSVTLPLGHGHLPQGQVSGPSGDGMQSAAAAYVNEALAWLPQTAEGSDGEIQPSPISEYEEPAGAPEKGTRVLLVDDNRDMRDYVSQLIGRKFTVEVAENGRVGLERALLHPPNLILTDVMMPEMDGFQLLAAVRQAPSIKDVPVIMLSARAGEESRVEGFEAGADDYLVKPFTARELMARINAHLAMAKLRREGAERERELLAFTQAERNRLQDVFLSAPAFIAIVIGPEHRFTLVNDQYLSVVGRKHASDLLGKPILEAMPEMHGQIFPKLLDRVYKSGVAHVGNEERALLPRGEHGQLEEVFFNFVYRPWRDASGAVEGVFIHAVDVTESVRARRAVEELASSLQKSEGRLRGIVEQIVSGICQMDLQGRLTFVNERFCEIAGKPAESLLGTEVFDLVVPEDREAGRAMFERLVHGGPTYESVQRFTRADKPPVWVQNNLSAVIGPSGAIESVVCVTQDITERKVTEEALRRSEKLAAVGQLASTIAHEINNPLESVMNLLYLIQGAQSPEDLETYARLANEELMRVSHVVTTTLSFHRQLAEATYEKLSGLLESAVALYQGRLRSADIRVVKRYSDAKPIRSYGGELRQVFANMIGNAFDATRNSADKRLLIRTRAATDPKTGEEGVRVTVADTGSGMSASTMAHIFEPFFTTKGTTGSGLGLWVSIDILKKHHATTRLKSREGRGTVFSMFFPLT